VNAVAVADSLQEQKWADFGSANMTTEEQKIIAQGRRYVEAQQAKIETQRVLIRDLETRGGIKVLSRLKRGLWAK
jgi:hypothetical protein